MHAKLRRDVRTGAPNRRSRLGWVLMFALSGASMAHAASPDVALPSPGHVRQPSALAISADGARLYVANARSGSVSIVDVPASRVVAEVTVGKGLSDLTLLADGRRLLAVDRAGDALILLELTGDGVRLVARRSVGPDPVRVIAAGDGTACAVSSTASRRVEIFDLAPTGQADRAIVARASAELPFSPRDMAAVADWSRLVVADAYGGKLAVLAPTTGTVDSVRSIPAHNIRGLAIAPGGRTLVVAHQILKRVFKTDFEDVHWGRLITSHIRSLRMDAVLQPGSDEDLLRGECTIDLGFATRGAGDPSALACDRSGRVAVALGGVDEVGLSQSSTGYVRRVGVGSLPSAIAVSADGAFTYAANACDDTVSVIPLADPERVRVIALGARPALSAVERGERLFYDARLSHDGWMSCHSCHTDGHSNGLVADTLGDDTYGAPKRVPTLEGVGETGPWAWNGAVERLEDQVRKSITITMQGRAPTNEQLADLTAYLRSLPPARPLPSADNHAVARGRSLFEERDCMRCHAGPAYAARGRFDVGLADELGNQRFNPPSLRGVGQRAPLLHDGRAATLGEVFLRHRHPRAADWTPAEVADLLAFLKSL